jgi:hypothetical protein
MRAVIILWALVVLQAINLTVASLYSDHSWVIILCSAGLALNFTLAVISSTVETILGLLR